MALDIFGRDPLAGPGGPGSGLPPDRWEEEELRRQEEERKRREAFSAPLAPAAKTPINYAPTPEAVNQHKGISSPDTLAPARFTDSGSTADADHRAATAARFGPSAKSMDYALDFSNAPHEYFVAEAEKAKAAMAQQFHTGGRAMEPLEEYQKLARVYGGEKQLGKRLQAVTSLWNIYMKPFDGKDTIWQMVKSPYTTQQLESMMSVGRLSVFGGGLVPSETAKKNGLDVNDPTQLTAANLVFQGSQMTLADVYPKRMGVWDHAASWVKKALQWSAKPAFQEGGLGQGTKEFLTQPASESPINPVNIAQGALNVHNWEDVVGKKGGPGVLEQAFSPESVKQHLAIGAAPMALGAGTALMGVGAGYVAMGGIANVAAGVSAGMAGSGLVYAGLGGAVEQAAPIAAAATQEAMRQQFAAQEARPLSEVNLPEVTYIKDTSGNIVSYQITTALDRVNLGSAYINSLSGSATLTEMQKDAQQDQYDARGNVVAFGRGKDLKVDGLATTEWQNVFRDISTDEERYKVEQAQLMKDAGAVPAWAPLDNLEHPVWKQACIDLTEKQTRQLLRAESNPVFAKWAEVCPSLPMDGPSVKFFFNRLFANGVAQGIYKSPIEVAVAVGEGFNGTMSAFGVWARLQNDAEYQQWKKDALAIAARSPGAQFTREGISLMNMEQVDTLYQDGKLPEAAAVIKQIKTREAETVQQRFSPAIALDLAHLAGFDAKAVEDFGARNMDFIHASQLVFDIGMGLVAPVKTKAPLARTVEAAMGDTRFLNRMERVIEDVQKGRDSYAAEQVSGGQASEFVRELKWMLEDNPVGFEQRALQAGADWWAGVYRREAPVGAAAPVVASEVPAPLSPVVAAPARAVAPKKLPAVKAGADLNVTDLRFKDAQAVEFIKWITDEGGNKAASIRVWGKKAGEGNQIRATEATVLPEDIAAINGKPFAKPVEATAAPTPVATPGAPPVAVTPAAPTTPPLPVPGMGDIFPYLQYPALRAPSEIARVVSMSLDGIGNGTVGNLLTHVAASFRKNALDMVEFDASTSISEVMTAARIASDSETFARMMGDKWINATNRFQRQAVADSVEARAQQRFDFGDKQSKGGGATYDIVPHPETGELIGEGSIIDTSYQRYKAELGQSRKAIFANYDLKASDMGLFEKVGHKFVDNPYRTVVRKVKGVAQFQRQWSVALGPQLFFKHAITDTLRSVIDNGPGAVLQARKTANAFDEMLQVVGPEAYGTVMQRLIKSELSEQHYNVGNDLVGAKWGTAHVYDESGKAVNMSKGANALRRVTQGESFRSYVTGGEKGLRDWLASEDGTMFLKESGNVRRVAEDTAREIDDVPIAEVIDDFAETYAHGYWDALDMNAPQIMDRVKAVIQSDGNMTNNMAASIIKEVNAKGVVENPWLSMPMEGTKTFGEKFKAFPGKTTGIWMTANKWNRRVIFKDTFMDVYGDLMKQGADADAAARVASTVADLNTARVHFDLSHAMQIEAQSRYFAYFATKHRLYATYVMKTAIQRPSLAGAALEVSNWIEENNEKQGETGYYKGQIIATLGGARLRFPIAPIFWFSDFPLESNIGHAMMTAGAQVIDFATGKEMHTGPGTFGWQIVPPIDNLVKTMAVYTPLLMKWRDAPGHVLTDEDVQGWLQDVASWPFVGKAGVAELNRSIGTARALEKYKTGADPNINDVVTRAVWSNLLYEIQNTVRLPAKLEPDGVAKTKLNKLVDQYGDLAPELRPDFLIKNPAVGMLFGLSDTDPTTKRRVDQGWAEKNRIQSELGIALIGAYKNNPDFDPTPIRKKAMDQLNQLYDASWRDPATGQPSPLYNKEFAAYWNTSGQTGSPFEEVMGSLYPLVDPSALAATLKEGYIPTTEQVDMENLRLREVFKKSMSEAGVAEGSMLYSYYLDKAVNEPLAEFSKTDPNQWNTYEQLTAAREMSMAPNGEAASKQYLLDTENQARLTMFKRGTLGTAKDGTSLPMFAVMTDAERVLIGMPGTETSRDYWDQYRVLYVTTKRYMEDHGISSSTKQGIAMLAAVDTQTDQYAKSDITFAKELDFSRKPLYERLVDLGVGDKTTDARSKGWGEFLSLVSDYHEEISNLVNPSNKKVLGVGPTSATARNTALEYLARVVALAKRNEDWKRNFMQTFSLSNFGFAWKLPDGSDRGLWVDEPAATGTTGGA